jgi:hypothetical protein
MGTVPRRACKHTVVSAARLLLLLLLLLVVVVAIPPGHVKGTEGSSKGRADS